VRVIATVFELGEKCQQLHRSHPLADPGQQEGLGAPSLIWSKAWRGRSRAARPAHWRPVNVLWLVLVVGVFAPRPFQARVLRAPAFPALAVLVGAAWAGGREHRSLARRRTDRMAAVGLAALWIGAGPDRRQVLDGLAS